MTEVDCWCVNILEKPPCVSFRLQVLRLGLKHTTSLFQNQDCSRNSELEQPYGVVYITTGIIHDYMKQVLSQ